MCDHCSCRDHPPIAELTAEHEAILDLAWTLAEAGGADGAGDDVRGALVAMLDVHVVKEETGLYPLLVALDGLAPAQSSALEDEHRELRATVLSGAFDRRDYFALAAHIEEEEMELFPAARFGFDDPAWDALVAAHAASGD